MLKTKSPWAAMAATLAVLACGSPASETQAAGKGKVADAALMPGELPGDKFETPSGQLTIHPINHATFLFQSGGKTYYVDPVGSPDLYKGLPKPDVLIITDVHGDHFSAETLTAVGSFGAVVVAPKAVADQLPAPFKPRTVTLANGQSRMVAGANIEAVPMYNLTPDRLQYHEKGRGNGYVITVDGKRLYVAGDTEDIPEMRALKDIDIAFVPFNLPYTMTPEQAADAVKAFRPKVVYPYHYRGSDVQKFKTLVGDAAEVRLGKWY